MKMRPVQLFALPILLLAAIPLGAGQKRQEYSSLRVDSTGQLHILTDSGREIIPPKIKYQVAFGEAEISPDHVTVGWFVEYDNSAALGFLADPVAGDLVLYRNERVLHRFSAKQSLWGWRFVDEGRRVAYTDGPLHGNPAECVLRDSNSGTVIERWAFKENAELPDWARGIRCDGE